MNQLRDVNLDAMRAEIGYRHDQLLASAGRRRDRAARHWWQRIALVPREHG